MAVKCHSAVVLIDFVFFFFCSAANMIQLGYKELEVRCSQLWFVLRVENQILFKKKKRQKERKTLHTHESKLSNDRTSLALVPAHRQEWKLTFAGCQSFGGAVTPVMKNHPDERPLLLESKLSNDQTGLDLVPACREE